MTRPQTTFEARLTDLFQSYAAAAPLEVDADALAAELTATNRGMSGFLRPLTAQHRWLAPALLTLLLMLALAMAVVVGAQLLRDRAPAFGPLVVQPVEFMSQQRSGASAVRLADGRVLIAGGTNGYAGANMAYAEIYDPTTQSFSALGEVFPLTARATATVLRDGRVLLAGGTDESGNATAIARLFDPRSGAFAPLPNLSAPRDDHAAVLMPDGRVVLIGGAATLEYFDPNAATFTVGPDVPDLRQASTIAFPLGGTTVLVLARDAPLFLDTSTGTSSPAMTASIADADFARLRGASRLGDGRVGLAVETVSSGAITSKLLVFDPASRTIAAMTDLEGVVMGPETLADGRLVFAYHQQDDCSTVYAEVFNPRDSSLKPIGQIGGIGGCTPGPTSTVTALFDGTALIAGGIMSSGQETSSASLVHP